MAVIVVSNRLPTTIRQTPDGIILTESVGGVATGLRGLQQESGGRWIGWPGITPPPDEAGEREISHRLGTLGCVPVFLSRQEIKGFYQGYANGVIWPLFHYLTQQVPLRQPHWESYEEANVRFADVVAAHCGPGDEVWVHDYHLMRLPALLRQRRPGVRCGFFLHIPFPSCEVFRILPSRRQVLEGLLGADLIGFHTAAYASHFTDCVTRLLGVPALEDGRLEFQGRTSTVGVFPMGVEVARFEAATGESPFEGVEAGRREGETADVQVLAAIDRLDYTKGIPRRLLAFEELLRRHPELRERVTLVQVAVPSRTGVRAYQRFRRHVDARVGRINGIYGTPGWTPVQYLYRGFSQAELVGLYRRADVMLVTPVRDGMNLVAKEFVASRVDGDGVLVLSEFAGAAAELTEAVLVNPYDIEASAEAYYLALTMPGHERRARMRALRARVEASPASRWGENFLTALRAAADIAQGPAPEGAVSSPTVVAEAMARVRKAGAALVLLDYDGTLVPHAPTPDLATPDEELLRLLEGLTWRPGMSLHIVSGRPRAVLEAWFGHLAIGLHAEHGAWSRLPGASAWERQATAEPVPYHDLLAVLRRYTGETPGSFIERKTAGIAWHFRLADRETGRRQADRLATELRERFSPDVVDVLRGEQVLECRPAGIHKGLIVERLLAAPGHLEEVVAIGDDTTDEEMFAALPAGGIGVHVGPRPSCAPLRLENVQACRAFLHGLLTLSPEPS